MEILRSLRDFVQEVDYKFRGVPLPVHLRRVEAAEREFGEAQKTIRRGRVTVTDLQKFQATLNKAIVVGTERVRYR